MKCIILASGRWTRLKPLTNTVPKPMIEICGKPILEHNLENIYKHVDEIILVVKYLKGVFIDYFGDNYKGVPIRYSIQWEEKWTAAALWWLESENDILLVYGDSIFEVDDLEQLIDHEGYWCLVKRVQNPEQYWVFVENSDGTADKIIEKPKEDYGNLTNTWAYKFSADIIKIAEDVSLSERGEYELTDAINVFCKKEKFQLLEMKWAFIDIWYPWHILSVNNFFLNNLKESRIEWEVEENVTIHWNIILKKWAILKSGTYIDGNCIIGEDAQIWPNAYIRGNTVIWTKSKVWNGVEVKNSNIGNNSSVPHLSYIWDSIIWNNVNIGWGTITANVRHDKKDMRCMINGKLVDTGIRKLWAIIGDNAAIGIKNSIYPGRVIDTGWTTLPGWIIK